MKAGIAAMCPRPLARAERADGEIIVAAVADEEYERLAHDR
jgi:hypothetical protein